MLLVVFVKWNVRRKYERKFVRNAIYNIPTTLFSNKNNIIRFYSCNLQIIKLVVRLHKKISLILRYV